MNEIWTTAISASAGLVGVVVGSVLTNRSADKQRHASLAAADRKDAFEALGRTHQFVQTLGILSNQPAQAAMQAIHGQEDRWHNDIAGHVARVAAGYPDETVGQQFYRLADRTSFLVAVVITDVHRGAGADSRASEVIGEVQALIHELQVTVRASES